MVFGLNVRHWMLYHIENIQHHNMHFYHISIVNRGKICNDKTLIDLFYSWYLYDTMSSITGTISVCIMKYAHRFTVICLVIICWFWFSDSDSDSERAIHVHNSWNILYIGGFTEAWIIKVLCGM